MVKQQFMRFCWLLQVLAMCALAQTSPVQLEALPPNLDSGTHAINVPFINHGTKKILAYVIEIREFDGAGTLIGEPQVYGTDNVFFLAYGEDSSTASSAIIAPGAETAKRFKLTADAVSAKVSVLAVVYLDRTIEGDPTEAALIFKTRALHAAKAASAAKLLQNYPASSDEVRSRLNELTSVSEKTGSAADLIRAGVPSKEQWSKVATEQAALADLLTQQSTEAK